MKKQNSSNKHTKKSENQKKIYLNSIHPINWTRLERQDEKDEEKNIQINKMKKVVEIIKR